MISQTTFITRGSTAYWTTTFYDLSNNVVQPDSATINLLYNDPSGTEQVVTVNMVAPTMPAVTWTAEVDTRGMGPGDVSWSIHTGTLDPIPVAVEDGSFVLTANPANLVTF